MVRQTGALARLGGLIDPWLMAQVIAFASPGDIRDVCGVLARYQSACEAYEGLALSRSLSESERERLRLRVTLYDCILRIYRARRGSGLSVGICDLEREVLEDPIYHLDQP